MIKGNRFLSSLVLFVTACGAADSSLSDLETSSLNHTQTHDSEELLGEDGFLAAPTDIDWSYFAGKDFGLRSDAAGHGAFGAMRRGTPSHRGIDFLVPEGTPLAAPCSGVYLSGYEASFGHWLQLICVLPSPTGKNPSIYASMLFAHLNSRAQSDGVNWRGISAGSSLGKSGRTGNAGGTNPHVHFEMTLHSTLSSAKNDLHGTAKPTPQHTKTFATEFKEACEQKYGFKFLSTTKLILNDRIDPFAFFSCFSKGKPALSTPSSQGLVRWSKLYSATAYDVNVGR